MKTPAQGRCAILLTLLFSALVSSPVLALDPLAPQLKAAIETSKSKLGQLAPWQEEIFLNEVLMSSGRFIRDYSSNRGVLTKVVVDTDGIKKYLSFHASQILKPENMNVILAVRAPEKCTACVGAVPFVRADLKSRLEHRGIQVITLNAMESQRDLMESMGTKGAVGSVLASLQSVEDPDHAGEFRYDLELEFRFPGTAASRIQKQMEVLQNDSIEVGMSRVAVDAISELGMRVQLARVGAMEQQGDEGVEIVLTGVTDFSQLMEVKRAIQNQLDTQGRIVERRLTSAQSVLAVFTDLPATEVSKLLMQKDLGDFKIQVASVSGQQIQAVYQPMAGGVH